MSLWRRSRAVRIIIWIALVLLVMAVLPWTYLYWRTERDLRAELQRIRDAGEPLSLAEIVPPHVPDDQNAALVYARYYPPGSRSPDDLTFAQAGDGELLRQFQADASVEAQVRQMLARPEVVEALAEIRRASQLPYAIAPDWTPDERTVPSLRAAYHSADWLRARALLAARDGDGAQALEWLAVLFRVADHLDGDPRVQYGGGVRSRACVTGWRILAATAVPAGQARALMQEMITPDPRQTARQELLLFRAQILDGFRGDPVNLLQGLGLDMSYLSDEHRLLVSNYDALLLRPVRNGDQLHCLYDLRVGLEVVSASGPPTLPRHTSPRYSGPVHELLAAFARSVHPVAAQFPQSGLGPLPLGAATRTSARVNALRTALAVVAHKGDHGEYPATLADPHLPPGCDPTADPLTGKPFLYRKQGDGFVLYSPGPDGDDDGGVEGDSSDGDLVWGRLP